jgi:thiamine-phosphate pyrophosphorylase
VTAKAPRLYLITDRKATNGRPLLDVVAQALSGARSSHQLAVQLREKDLSGRELFELACALRPITSAAGAWLFVNDRIDVALAAGADGVHLAGGSLSASDVRALGPLRVAASTHTADDVARAAAAGVDFVVFGPVFATASKPAVAPVGLATLKIVTGLGIPVLALGGVTADNVADCLISGAVGVAGIRFVISATNSAERVSSLLACLAPSET